MIVVYSSNGEKYEFPDCDNYKFGGDTIKLYDNGSQVGNFIVANIDCVVNEGVTVNKPSNRNS